MSIDLYMLPPSAPCRAVIFLVEALDIAEKVKQIHVDLPNKEQLKPEFIKLNPQHTIPTIVDDEFVLWESRAILRYLVTEYGGDDNPLYPADAKTRALIDQRLDFDLGTLSAKFEAHFYPQFEGREPEEGSLERLQEALGFLNTFLEEKEYVAGENLTIADLSLVATVGAIEGVGISIEDHPNVVKWYELVKTTAPNYEKVFKELSEFAID